MSARPQPDGAPLAIEVAISPFRAGEPVEDCAGMIREATACFAAGAAIVHHHHDFRLDAAGSITEMTTMGRAVLAQYPGALLYPDPLAADDVLGRHAHLAPLASAGLLGYAPVDPGAAFTGQLDEAGLPYGTNTVRSTFDDANEVMRLADACGVPVTIGVFEPGQLRYALAYRAAGRLPAGSMVKLYFGGRHSLVHTGRPALNFGLTPTIAAVDAYQEMLAGTGIPWSVGIMGDVLLESPIARYAVECGGHLRVGIEDAAGLSAATNADMVAAAVTLADEVGRPVVTASTH